MAYEWIPMRCDLEGDPAVMFLARETKLDIDTVVGKLHRFWSWVSAHTADGRLPGIDVKQIDDRLRKRGFAAAMAAIPEHPWLKIVEGGLEIPHFERWLSSGAKSRMSNTARQQKSRRERDTGATNGATKARPHNNTEHLLAPAHGAADWASRVAEAKAVTERLGPCGSERNKRLVLAACVLAAGGDLPPDWLEVGIRETREARPDKPYAFLRTVLIRTGEAAGWDVRTGLAAVEFPAKAEAAT